MLKPGQVFNISTFGAVYKGWGFTPLRKICL